MSTRAWRLLITEPTDGARNMAIDEALWRGRRVGTTPPTLRFFGWEPPTLSLGYGQALGPDVDLEACRRLGVGVVRRPTGGGAIYHDGPDRELTYTVVAAREDFAEAANLLTTYRWIAAALVRGLQALGARAEIVPVVDPSELVPAFCFARTSRYEIEVGGRKIVGSAQRRQGDSFLQHGAVLLGADSPRLRMVFPTTADPLATMTTLEEALGHRPKFDEVAAALARAFEEEHGLRLERGGLVREESELAERLVREKYATQAWLTGTA